MIRLTFFASVLAVGLAAAQPAFDAKLLGQNDKVGRYAKIRGFNMYYEIYGQGDPLLIIHGNGGSIDDFVNQVPFFASKYKVILADSRAQGKSIDQGDSLSYEMMAGDLNALLDHLKIDSANVIGWSDGGIEGLLLAIHYPVKVKKLAITGANLRPDTSAVDPWVHYLVRDMYDSLARLPVTPELKTLKKLVYLLPNEPHIPVTDLKKISCPTLVIAGDHDVILNKHTVQIAEAIPKSYLWILPNSGHSTPVFYKDDFNRQVFDFFTKPYRRIEKAGRFR